MDSISLSVSMLIIKHMFSLLPFAVYSGIVISLNTNYAFVSNVYFPSGFDNVTLNIQLGALYDWLEHEVKIFLIG